MDNKEMVAKLSPLARTDTRRIDYGDRFAFLSAFVTRKTETFQSMALPMAGLLVVVEGVKTIVWSGRTFIYAPGGAFALRAGSHVDVINEPDADSGVYRAVYLGFSAELLAEARRKWSSLAAGHTAQDPTVHVTPPLASAILHAAEALAGVVEVSARVTEQRIQEILLILAEMGAAPLRPDLKTSSATNAVRLSIRDAPAASWSTGRLAETLCTSEPTLRRRLRREGSSFRQILAEERMRLARDLLSSGAAVAEAASVGGYASLSHFAKRFRSIYGRLPSSVQPDSGVAG